MKNNRIVILGAGPTGLAAGWKLTEAGYAVDVLERESLPGGLCRSTVRDGFIFDLGGHRFITKDAELSADIEGLMGDAFMVRPRQSRIRLQGKFFDYPLVLKDVLTKMPLGISAKTGLDFIRTRIGTYAHLDDTTFENWIIKRFGRTMYDIYFGPYSHKLWGLPSDQISANWASQRISLINLTDVLLRALGKQKDMPKTYARQFLYPKEGIGQIAHFMADSITARGGTVHYDARVTQVVRTGNRIERIIYEQAGESKELMADYTISTIPLPDFIKQLTPAVDAEYRHWADTMSFRSLTFLHIMFDGEEITDDTWMYIPEEKYLFFRIQNRRQWSPTTVPAGKNALTLEIACTKGDRWWQASDEALFDRAMEGLEELGFVHRSQVTGYFSERCEHAYPLYTLDYNQKVGAVYTCLAQLEDCLSIGRQGLFRYNNMDHSLKMGILTARHIIEGYPREAIFDIATEKVIFDWHDKAQKRENRDQRSENKVALR